jgi:AbrB family looped-hinge helix DNA binding protein
MKTNFRGVLKIGSSLYVSIPKEVQEELGIEEGTTVKFAWLEDKSTKTVIVEKAG